MREQADLFLNYDAPPGPIETSSTNEIVVKARQHSESLKAADQETAVIVDTENTGLDHTREEVIEFGTVAYLYDEDSGIGNVIGTFNAMHEPSVAISPGRCHGWMAPLASLGSILPETGDGLSLGNGLRPTATVDAAAVLSKARSPAALALRWNPAQVGAGPPISTRASNPRIVEETLGN